MKKLYIYSVLFGASLGYSSLYLFHFFVPFVVFLLGFGLYKNDYKINKDLSLLCLFYFLILFSYFFSDYHTFYINYIVYTFLSLLVLVSLYFLTLKNYNLVLRIFIFFSFLQLFFGLVESFGILRLPFSPYSSYAHYFGKSNDYIDDWSLAIMDYNLSKPTGFSGNPNTFGFVALLFAPLLCFYPNKKIYKILFSISFLVLFYKIDSKSLFFTYIFGFLLYYFLFEKIKVILYMIPLFLLLPIVSFLNFDFDSNARIFSVFDEMSKGFNLIFSDSNNSDMDTSTGFRSYLYSTGIKSFIETNGIGLGIGGIESYLNKIFGQHTAFHNFFLQLLVDLGILGFLIFMLFYLKLIYRLWKGSFTICEDLNHISKILTVIVICGIFSSIAPSGIFYCLPFWAMLGFALGVTHLKKNQGIL